MKSITKIKDDVFFIADNYGWRLIDFQEKIGMISFTKEKMRINVYLTKMTVVRNINGTAYYLKNVTIPEFELMCINPEEKIREHETSVVYPRR